MADRSAPGKGTAPRDRAVLLSTLWVFASLSYIYADVFNLFFNKSGVTAAAPMSAGFVFFFALMMLTALAMIVLCRVLPYLANRWTNVCIGLLHTLLVIYSLTQGTPLPFYMLFAAVEIACTLFIIWYAWTWRERNQAGKP